MPAPRPAPRAWGVRDYGDRVHTEVAQFREGTRGGGVQRRAMKIALLLLGLVGGIAVVGGLPGSGSAPFESAASGPQVTYWSNGTKKSATEYRNGGRTARSEQWHSNGQRASRGQTENGLREGAWE